MGKKAYLEALLEQRPDAPAYVVFDAVAAKMRRDVQGLSFGAIVLPLEAQQVTFAGISGSLPSGKYVFVPWHTVCWIGRDWGSPAATGLTWDKRITDRGVRIQAHRPELSGPFTRGQA